MRDNHLIALLLMVPMLFLATASEARQISDKQKKEIVYQTLFLSLFIIIAVEWLQCKFYYWKKSFIYIFSL